jgi:hypothetical protein
MTVRSPNKPNAANLAIASLFHAGRQCRKPVIRDVLHHLTEAKGPLAEAPAGMPL